MDSLICNMTHNIRHYRFKLTNIAAFTLKVTAAVFIYQTVILTVIIPDRASSIFQHMFFQQTFPVLTGFRVGIIYKYSFASPPSSHSRLIIGTRFNKHPFGFHLFQHRMNQQDSWLHIWSHSNSSICHLLKEIFRIFKSLFVPGKYTALHALICLHSTITR